MIAEALVDPETWRIVPSTKPTTVISSPLCQMNRVLRQMQCAEESAKSQNPGKHAHRTHQHGLKKPAEKQFFDHGPSVTPKIAIAIRLAGSSSSLSKGVCVFRQLEEAAAALPP